MINIRREEYYPAPYLDIFDGNTEYGERFIDCLLLF